MTFRITLNAYSGQVLRPPIRCGGAQTCRCITSHLIERAAFFRRPLVVRFATRSVRDLGRRAGDGISTTRGLFRGALSPIDGSRGGAGEKARGIPGTVVAA